MKKYLAGVIFDGVMRNLALIVPIAFLPYVINEQMSLSVFRYLCGGIIGVYAVFFFSTTRKLANSRLKYLIFSSISACVWFVLILALLIGLHVALIPGDGENNAVGLLLIIVGRGVAVSTVCIRILITVAFEINERGKMKYSS